MYFVLVQALLSFGVIVVELSSLLEELSVIDVSGPRFILVITTEVLVNVSLSVGVVIVEVFSLVDVFSDELEVVFGLDVLVIIVFVDVMLSVFEVFSPVGDESVKLTILIVFSELFVVIVVVDWVCLS